MIENLRVTMRGAVQSGAVRRAYESAGVRPNTGDPESQSDQLVSTFVGMSLIKRFYEGYYGKRFTDQMEEGRKLRVSDPKLHAATIKRLEALVIDLSQMRGKIRVVEAITTSDLIYGLATTRDIVRRDNLPAFRSDLFDLAKLRTVENFNPVAARGSVNLLDRFLPRTPEGTNVRYTGWIGTGEYYSASKFEVGVSITWEAIMNDTLGEYQDAMYELGQAAARTRAWVLLDAVRTQAFRLPLPNAALGPNIGNIDAARNYLANQTVNGRPVSRGISDIYLPNNWTGTANAALTSQGLTYGGYVNTTTPGMSTSNPVYGIALPHAETIITEAGVDAYAGQSVNDWIAADRTTQPLELSRLRGFEAGPKTLTRVSETAEFDSGDFGQMVFEMKILDAIGAAVKDKTGIILVAGA